MLQAESILTPQETRLCLVLQYLIDELAIIIEQTELLGHPKQKHLLIALP